MLCAHNIFVYSSDQLEEMPIVKSQYKAPFIFRNYHVSTIYAATVRTASVSQQRERLELEDSDFLDLDWSFSTKGSSEKVLVVIHGLEGSAKRPYVTGLAAHFIENGWDVAAVNLRGCSGEINRKFSSYHAGSSDDLEIVLQHILQKQQYKSVALNGFSLGANIMLKYLGEKRDLPKELKAAVMVSAPCDLHGSLKKINETRNYFYNRRFVKLLKEHLLQRAHHFPGNISEAEITACDDLQAIDDLYTSKAHNFENALDYYSKNSSRQFLFNIKIPTLILNARNDGFLSSTCYPVDIAKDHKSLYLEMPAHGGHVAFLQKTKVTYNEERALEFLSEKT